MITLITGVPGTGKTAFVVSELEKIAASGRVIFTNIRGLKIPHYRIGSVSEWQKGTWLHIDRYLRRSPSIAMESPSDGEVDFWETPSEVIQLADTGEYKRLAFDKLGQPVGTVDYESHKGALLVIDECQDHFRPRPVGSAVPDHVAALEVHRHQGLDIWLITQRPGLVDSNVRSLVGRHIALRSTSLGRYKYEWPESGDIESKMSRDTAARSRYTLPKHVFNLYQSAEVHTTTRHTLPFAARALFLVLPLLAVLLFVAYRTISGKFNPPPVVAVQAAAPAVSAVVPVGVSSESLPGGLEPYQPRGIVGHHPFERFELKIIGRIRSASRDLYRFDAGAFSVSSVDLVDAGYQVIAVSDCSAKLVYGSTEIFVTCGTGSRYEPMPLPFQPAEVPLVQPAHLVLR